MASPRRSLIVVPLLIAGFMVAPSATPRSAPVLGGSNTPKVTVGVIINPEQSGAPHDLASVPATASADERPEGSPSPVPSASAVEVDPSPVALASETPPSPTARPITRASVAPGSGVLLTWYCNATHPEVPYSACRAGYPDRPGVVDLYAAVTADLAYLDGRFLTVSANGQSVTVRAVDRCDCGTNHVDLYADAFAVLAGLSVGSMHGGLLP